APAAAVGQGPEDAVDHQAVVLPLAAAPAVGGQQVLDLGILAVGELVGRGGYGHAPLLGKETWIPSAPLYHNAPRFTSHDLALSQRGIFREGVPPNHDAGSGPAQPKETMTCASTTDRTDSTPASTPTPGPFPSASSTTTAAPPSTRASPPA